MNNTRISDLRKNLGWTQEQLSEESTVAVRTIQRLESGSDASMETLSLIAKALNVNVRDLFETVDNESFEPAVENLDARRALQQKQRQSVTRAYKGLYYGLGVIVALVMTLLIGGFHLPRIWLLVVAAYWAGGYWLVPFLVEDVLATRLDSKYPLTASARNAQ